MDQPHSTEETAGLGLASPSFFGLALTQLLTAVNDNVLRWLVIGVGKDYVPPSQTGTILMAGTACFVAPYLLLAATAGYLADRFSKRSVIVGCKIGEILIMVLAITGIVVGSLPLLLVTVLCMGAQSALFSPAKLGSIPELLRTDRISAANGVFGLVTVAATVIGMAVGGMLKDATGLKGQDSWWISAVTLLAIALVGTAASLLIRSRPAANPTRRFPLNPFAQTWRDVGLLARHRPMLRVTLGMVFFWSLGALAQLNIDEFSYESGGRLESDRTPLLIALVLGVGVGSVLAGIWSGGRVELGILPLGAAGVSLFSLLLFGVDDTIMQPGTAITAAFVWALVLLFLLGASAGMFDIPLEAYMQHRSPTAQRGAILAAANFLVFLGVLMAAGLFFVARLPLQPGSLAAVSTADWGPLPAPAERADIERSVAEYRTAWEAGGESPGLEAALAGTEGAARRHLLGELVWIELEEREARGEAAEPLILDAAWLPPVSDEEARLVQAVARQHEGRPLLSSRQIFLAFGIGTVPVFLYIVLLIPQASIRFVVWLASHTVYRIRVLGRGHLPDEGGALLVCNHISWLDGVLLLMTSSRPIRMIAHADHLQGPVLRRLARMWGVIPMGGGPKSIQRALESARRALESGELVCIFPEGEISRSGQLQPFRRGALKMIEGLDVPVVPVFLDELWGSIFSYHGGKFFWKRPRKWPYPVSIHFGPPVERPEHIHEIRQAVQELGARAVEQRTGRSMLVTEAFIRSCKRRKRAGKVVDTLGGDLTAGSLLLRTLIFRRLLRKHILDDDERFVGVLLPPSAAGVVANAALAIDRRVAVNLNYTVSSEVMNSCVRQSDIRHVLTSRRFFDKLQETERLQLDAEMVFLEDLREKPTLGDKLAAATATYVVPAGRLVKSLGLHEVQAEDLLTVIFTSGSTGDPKGVMLTYGNIGSNIDAIETVVQLNSDDVLIGILPFFHSFGFTATLWTVLSLDVKGAYHFTPLDARQVGKLCRDHKGTILLSTPTFLRSYLRRCTHEDLDTLDVVVAGAEKLPSKLCDAFEEKFGVRPVEGYGATELSPLVAVNVPPSRSMVETGEDSREGTVGRPVPGVTAKVVDLDTGEDLGVGESGMLLVRGPNVMAGYLGRDDLTAKVVRDGWYVTGDVARIDEDGFIQITGRESRFAKIGGEMVPLIQIEETISRILGAEEEGTLLAAVTAVRDERKGERLVVVHLPLNMTPNELCAKLKEEGLPNLFIPSEDSFLEVQELPCMGTGKLDLRSIKRTAEERFEG